MIYAKVTARVIVDEQHRAGVVEGLEHFIDELVRKRITVYASEVDVFQDCDVDDADRTRQEMQQ